MKSTLITLAAFTVLAASTVQAQQNVGIGVTVRAEAVVPTKNDNLGTDGNIDLGGSTGFAAAVDVPLGRSLSFEAEAATLPMEATLVPPDGLGGITLGELESRALTASLRYHFLRGSRADLYVGGGATFVTYGDMESSEIRDEGIDRIELEKSVGPAVGLGLIWQFGHIGFNLDGKYRMLKSDTRAKFTDGDTSSNTVEIDLDNLAIGAGFTYRF